jgi:hypothetical protein
VGIGPDPPEYLVFIWFKLEFVRWIIFARDFSQSAGVDLEDENEALIARLSWKGFKLSFGL